MKYIKLEMSKYKEARNVHGRLAASLDFPDYYGNNLDALYEVLTEYSDDVCFYILPGCKKSHPVFSAVIRDAAEENEHIHIVVKER